VSQWSKSEMLVVAGARALAGRRVCFVGIGLPNIAVALAQRTVAPGIELVYESGVYGARPARLPLSIGDPCLVTGATAAMSMVELFSYYLQGGLVDVGFLGAAQLDRFGNINTTVIGDYQRPKVRLPGSGGACEIAINAREVFVLMRQSARSFVERIDRAAGPRWSSPTSAATGSTPTPGRWSLPPSTPRSRSTRSAPPPAGTSGSPTTSRSPPTPPPRSCG
jgi:glutaconate CoA-transferase, subunit B